MGTPANYDELLRILQTVPVAPSESGVGVPMGGSPLPAISSVSELITGHMNQGVPTAETTQQAEQMKRLQQLIVQAEPLSTKQKVLGSLGDLMQNFVNIKYRRPTEPSSIAQMQRQNQMEAQRKTQANLMTESLARQSEETSYRRGRDAKSDQRYEEELTREQTRFDALGTRQQEALIKREQSELADLGWTGDMPSDWNGLMAAKGKQRAYALEAVTGKGANARSAASFRDISEQMLPAKTRLLEVLGGLEDTGKGKVSRRDFDNAVKNHRRAIAMFASMADPDTRKAIIAADGDWVDGLEKTYEFSEPMKPRQNSQSSPMKGDPSKTYGSDAGALTKISDWFNYQEDMYDLGNRPDDPSILDPINRDTLRRPSPREQGLYSGGSAALPQGAKSSIPNASGAEELMQLIQSPQDQPKSKTLFGTDVAIVMKAIESDTPWNDVGLYRDDWMRFALLSMPNGNEDHRAYLRMSEQEKQRMADATVMRVRNLYK